MDLLGWLASEGPGSGLEAVQDGVLLLGMVVLCLEALRLTRYEAGRSTESEADSSILQYGPEMNGYLKSLV